MGDLLGLGSCCCEGGGEGEILTPETSSRISMVGIALTVDIKTVASTKRVEYVFIVMIIGGDLAERWSGMDEVAEFDRKCMVILWTFRLHQGYSY
jgi:hypothetical protein